MKFGVKERFDLARVARSRLIILNLYKLFRSQILEFGFY